MLIKLGGSCSPANLGGDGLLEGLPSYTDKLLCHVDFLPSCFGLLAAVQKTLE